VVNPPLDGVMGVVSEIAELATKLLAAELSRKSAAETVSETALVLLKL
jgi:hypothetical protein